MLLSRFATLWLAFACCGVLRASYDAESDIGLVAGDTKAADENTRRLNAALDAMWCGGKFSFGDGRVAPVLQPIEAAGKTFYFRGTIQTNIRIGGVLRGAGIGYEMSDAGYLDERAPQGGMITRFVKLDPENGPFVRLRGAAFTLEGIEFYGRRLLVGSAGSATGPKTKTLIEVEGRTSPVCTGYHQLRNIALNEAECGIRAMAGYYRDGQFVPSEDHADQTSVDRLHCSALDCVYRSENQQAVFWNFRNIIVNDFGYGEGVVVFDVQRGGNLTCENVQLNHSRVTLLRLKDCAHPNANHFAIENMRWDHSAKNGYLTLVSYVGKSPAASVYDATITGHLNNPNIAFDASRLMDLPGSLPRQGFRVNVVNMPTDCFEPVNGWWRPR